MWKHRLNTFSSDRHVLFIIWKQTHGLMWNWLFMFVLSRGWTLQIFGTFNSSVRIRRVQGRGQNIRLRLKKPHIVLKTVLWDLRQKPDFSLRTEGFKAHGGSEDRRPADEFHSAASVLSAASSLHLLCFTFMLFSFSEQTRRVTHRCSLFVLLTGQIKATFHLWRWLQLREITSTGRRKHNGSCSQSQDSYLRVESASTYKHRTSSSSNTSTKQRKY